MGGRPWSPADKLVPLLLRETRLNRTHKHVHTCTRVHVYYTRVHTFPVSPVIPAITLHRTGAGITTGFSAALSAPPVCDRPASLCLRDRGVCAGSPSGLRHGGLTWACRLPSICISSLNPQHHSEDFKSPPSVPPLPAPCRSWQPSPMGPQPRPEGLASTLRTSAPFRAGLLLIQSPFAEEVVQKITFNSPLR